MKRIFIIFIVGTLLFAVLPCFGDYTSRASWEEQIIEFICDGVGEIYEKARELSDLDFEMEKGELAVELKRIGTSKKELDKRQQGFMNALFLFIPGSSDIYDNIIKRIETNDSYPSP